MKELALRVINADKTSYGGFMNSTAVGSIISAPDWNTQPKAGGGIHGWLWGFSRHGKEFAGKKIWQVVEVPEDGIDLGYGKWKWREVRVVYSGNQAEAMSIIDVAYARYRAFNRDSKERFENTTTQNAAGECYNVCGMSTEPYSGYLRHKYGSSSIALKEQSMAAVVGCLSTASTLKPCSAAVAVGTENSSEGLGVSSLVACIGVDGKVKAGPNSYVVLGYHENYQLKLKGANVGYNEGDLLPNTWYELDKNHNFVVVQ